MRNTADTTALILEHRVKKGRERQYEAWLAAIVDALENAPGFIGRDVYPPVGQDRPYIIVGRFETGDDLQAWLASPEKDEFHRRLPDMLDDADQTTVTSGADLRLPSVQNPAPYKVFLITVAVLYPIGQLLPRALEPFHTVVPLLKNTLISGLILTIVVVALMSHFIMPQLTHRRRRWLFGTKERPPKSPVD